MIKKSLVKLACKQNKLKSYTCLLKTYINHLGKGNLIVCCMGIFSLRVLPKKYSLISFFFKIVTQMQKTKIRLLYINFVRWAYIYLVDLSMYFNYGFDFFTLAHDMIVNWWNKTLGKLGKHQDGWLELCAEVWK